MIDRRNHHLFQPLLYQVATAGLNPSDIAHPIRSILADQPNARVLLAEVVADRSRSPARSPSTTARYVPYRLPRRRHRARPTRTSVNDEWERHAPGLKTIEDALEIRRRVLLAFERAERSRRPGDERRRSHASSSSAAARPGWRPPARSPRSRSRRSRREFRADRPRLDATVILLEGADRILGTYPESLSRKAERQLRDLGVDLRLGVTVTDVDATTCVDDHRAGTIRARHRDLGRRQPRLPARRHARRCRPIVPAVSSSSADLSVTGHPDVFASATSRTPPSTGGRTRRRPRGDPGRRARGESDPGRPRRRAATDVPLPQQGRTGHDRPILGRRHDQAGASGSRAGSRGWPGGRSTSCSSSTSGAGSACCSTGPGTTSRSSAAPG